MKKYIENHKYASAHANKYGWGPQTPLAEYKYQELKKCITGKRILDVGCGPGHFVDRLSRDGYKAFGIDITSEFINFAKNTYQGNFFLGNAYGLPFKDKSFDTVFIRSVLEHLDDDVLALKECLRVGKRVVVTVPTETPTALKKRGVLYLHYQDRTHLRNYTHRSLTHLFKKISAKAILISNTEQLPLRTLLFDSLRGNSLLKRIIIKILFSLFGERKHYLELLAIIK